MKEYITESIDVFESFGKIIIDCANTPVKKDLFNKGKAEHSKLLSNDKSADFHHAVSKLLYVSKRSRVDIELEILYLFTGFLCSTDGD